MTWREKSLPPLTTAITAFETAFTEKATKIGITALSGPSLLAAANEATEIAAA
jgi:hypothetical protein